MCSSGQEETVEHLLATCTAYARERMRMEARVQAMLGMHVTTNNAMSTQGQVNLLLGGPGAWRRGAVAARMASKATQRFLKQAWRRRRQVTRRINEELDRHDLVDVGDAPTEKFRQAEARDFVRQGRRSAHGEETPRTKSKHSQSGARSVGSTKDACICHAEARPES